MADSTDLTYPWVVFTLKQTLFAVSAEHVQAMVITPDCVAVPHTPPYVVRGVVNLRGRVIPLLDLRSRLGMPSILEEVDAFCRLMEQREQDHRNWLAELEASVQEKRPFKLARDPHQCAFGKWYDSYKPDSYTLASLLGRFDAPHRKIHAIADQVDARVQHDDFEGANRIIEECRERELAEMIKLFGMIRQAYQESLNEISVVVEQEAGVYALAVDSVDSVEQFQEGSIAEAPETFQGKAGDGMVRYSGRRKKDDALVFILDTPQLVAGLAGRNG